MPGYLAFPPTPDPTANPKPFPLPSEAHSRTPFASTQNTPTRPSPAEAHEPSKHATAKQLEEQAWAERRRRDAELHQARLERERAEAWLGELAWVRSGGIVRDVRGRRDMARTELLRAEIRLQDEEKRIMDRWSGYETRWRLLALSSADEEANIKWEDVPWPVATTAQSVDDLTPGAIEEFIFAPLKVRGKTDSRKDKLRSSILRWHPDKDAVILSRVAEEDRWNVQEGVNAVFRALKELQDAEKASQL